jgi:hypothetical protein
MSVQYARFETKTAPLASEFGFGYALKLFGPAVNRLPRHTSGPNAGKLKGSVVWHKCAVGGWYKTKPVLPGLLWAGIKDQAGNIVELDWREEGVVEKMEGYAETLRDEGRAKYVADRAQAKIDAEKEAAAKDANIKVNALLDKMLPVQQKLDKTTDPAEKARLQAEFDRMREELKALVAAGNE